MGRTLGEFDALGPGERALLSACRSGTLANLGTTTPDLVNDSIRVRAAFLRFLLLGGDEKAPVHERGVQLCGAFIEGPLILIGCRVPFSVDLVRCYFEDQFNAMDSEVSGLLNLEGSYLSKGLEADRLRCSNGLHLSRRFKAMGGVTLKCAHIGGHLDAGGGLFDGRGGDSISADGINVTGGVFLNDDFKATGEVRLLCAQIGGNLECANGKFEASHSDALSADNLQVKGDVFLSDGFKAAGEVRLLGAQIGGNLNCRNGVFEIKDGVGNALFADRAEIKGDVFLGGGCKADAMVMLRGAQIGGNLDCSAGKFTAGEGFSIIADGVNVVGDIYFSHGFESVGEVRLLGAQVGGDLVCSGANFDASTGRSLSFDRASIKGGVFFKAGFRSSGIVRFCGAQIGSNLDCGGGYFEVTAGAALSADGASVLGAVFLGNGFQSKGEVRLLGVQIRGSLDCSGGIFEARDGDAISADRLNVGDNIFLCDGFSANGKVRLLSAYVGGNLECGGGNFEAGEGDALVADSVNVHGNVYIGKDFVAIGTVRLLGAKINGDLECSGGRFMANAGPGLRVDGASVRGVWHLWGLSQPARVNASHTDVAVLVDDLEAWAPGSILDGFRYETLGGMAPTSGKVRLDWLLRQDGQGIADLRGGLIFRPQPWRHIQRVLREMGHIEDAKQVGIAFEDHRRAIGYLGQSPQDTPIFFAWLKRMIAQCAHYTFGKLAGYGYRPIRLLAWMASVWVLCGVAYWWLALPPRSVIAPSDPLIFQSDVYRACQPDYPGVAGNWYLCDSLRGEYATFSPLAFSLDLLLPLVDLGQEKTWGAYVPTPNENPMSEFFCNFHWGHVARILIWLETLFGWLSSLLLVAIVSGFSRRNDDD